MYLSQHPRDAVKQDWIHIRRPFTIVDDTLSINLLDDNTTCEFLLITNKYRHI